MPCNSIYIWVLCIPFLIEICIPQGAWGFSCLHAHLRASTPAIAFLQEDKTMHCTRNKPVLEASNSNVLPWWCMQMLETTQLNSEGDDTWKKVTCDLHRCLLQLMLTVGDTPITAQSVTQHHQQKSSSLESRWSCIATSQVSSLTCLYDAKVSHTCLGVTCDAVNITVCMNMTRTMWLREWNNAGLIIIYEGACTAMLFGRLNPSC